MKLTEVEESLQTEYNKLISELQELKLLYDEAKKKHSEMELNDLELYYELEDLSDKLNEDTKTDEKNEKQYIEDNCNKLAIKIPFTCGISVTLSYSIVSLLTETLIMKPILTTGIIAGHLSTGIIIGIAIYALYKKKYQSILKERYKHTDIHKKHSTEHYDKTIKLIGKKENYNKYHQEYLKVKDEYIEIEKKFLSKQEELKQFKEKMFKILFSSELEESLSIDIYELEENEIVQKKEHYESTYIDSVDLESEYEKKLPLLRKVYPPKKRILKRN